jgi:hypothetical protein
VTLWVGQPQQKTFELILLRTLLLLLFDVRGGQGAIHIIKTQDNKHVDKVEPVKEGENLVMVL